MPHFNKSHLYRLGEVHLREEGGEGARLSLRHFLIALATF